MINELREILSWSVKDQSKISDALISELYPELEFNDAIQNYIELKIAMEKKWKIHNRIHDIVNQHVVAPNGTQNVDYFFTLDFEKYNWTDISEFKFNIEGLEGLEIEQETKEIKGQPTVSGEFDLIFLFRINGQEPESEYNKKTIRITINPDPKTLWKNIPSDKDLVFWKPDEVSISSSFTDRKIIAASKRGRSHANSGTCRDDHFEVLNLDNGWSTAIIADGAGSAKFSRKGSELACQKLIEFLQANFSGTGNLDGDLDLIIKDYIENPDANSQAVSYKVYDLISKSTFYVHQELEAFAKKNEFELKALHTTLAFVIIKKFGDLYAIISFGVGDCPIGLISEGGTRLNLLNKLDVGEFGGGTRFITMKEIFSDNLSSRISIKLIQELDYLMLMTDGIYDPKFVVEANLEKIENWNNFLDDIKGDNTEGIGVDFNSSEDESEKLLGWMDFWSPGNHDDRTLAIIF